MSANNSRRAVSFLSAIFVLSSAGSAALTGAFSGKALQGSSAPAAKPATAGTSPQAEPPAPNRGQAYYHYSLAHMYEELGMAYSRQDYFTKAVEHLRLAMKYDPNSAFVNVELAELYAQTNRIAEAVSEAEDILKRFPDNLDARRLLGRIYVRSLGENGPGVRRSSQTEMLKKAVDQFEKITKQDPKDVDSLLTLARLYRLNNDSVKAEAAFQQAVAVEPDNDEALVSLAQFYGEIGRTQEAAKLLEKASSHNQNPRLLAMLGETYEKNHEYDKAVEIFRRALEQDKDDPDLMRSLATDLLATEQYDEALKIFQDVIKLDPQDANAYLHIGQIYRQKRQFDRAVDNFRKAQALSPDNPEVTYDLAVVEEMRGAPEEAIRLLKKLLDDTSKPEGMTYTAPEKANRAVFEERLAFLYSEQQKYTESEAAFRQVMVMDPDSAPHAEISLIEMLRRARDYQKARQEADAAVKKYPEDRSLRMTRAGLLADLGSVDPSVKELKEMLQAKSSGDADKDSDDRREVYLNLTQIYEHAKRFDEAVDSIQQAEKLAKNKDQKEMVYYFGGEVYEHAKKLDEAEKMFRKALELNPDSAMTLNYLGYMLADNGLRLEEAVKLIGHALELEPQRGEYMDSLGWAYFKQGRYDLAEQYLLKAAQRQAKDATIKDHLADLYFKTNRTRDAMQKWQEALAEWKNTLPGDTDPLDVTKVQKKLDEARVRLAKEGK
jgi:tetratricopeptide (TPR) repeat protein